MVSEMNGCLIKPRNSKELERALTAFAEMPNEELANKKQASLDIVKKDFLWDEVGQKTFDSIRRVTHSNKQS